MEAAYFVQWHSSPLGWYDVRQLADKAEAERHRLKIAGRQGERVVERPHAA